MNRRASTEPLIVSIVDALAEDEYWKTHDLQLYDYIDTDALTTLIGNTPPATNLEVHFQIEGQRVVVTADGTVQLEEV